MQTKTFLMKRIYYGWVIVATLCVVSFATATTGTLNLGLFIIPMSNDLGISRSLFGWLSTSRSLASGTSSAILGGLVDKFGVRLLLPLASLITGLCLIGVGMSSHVYQLFILFCIMGLVGLSGQGGSLLSSVPVAKWFVRKRGRALAVASLGMGIGPVVFVPVTQLLIDGVGWRMAWIVLASIGMAIIIPLALMFVRRQPEDMGLLPDGDASPVDEGIQEQTPSVEEEETWTVRETIRTRAFWLLAASLMLGGFAMGSSVHRIPYWTELGFDPQLVSLAFSVDAAGAATMIMAAGLLLERFPPRIVAAGSYAGFASATVLMLIATSSLHMFASTALFGSSVGINMVCQTYLWASYYGRAFLGTIRGVTMPITMLAIAAGAPVAGYIYDFTGSYELAWQIAIAAYVSAFAVMLCATPPRRRPDHGPIPTANAV